MMNCFWDGAIKFEIVTIGKALKRIDHVEGWKWT